MKLKIQDRQLLSAIVVSLYLIPFLFFSYYSIGLMPHDKSWSILSFGLLIVSGGSLALFFFICYWEEALRIKIQNNLIPSLEGSEKESKVMSLEPALNESLKELHLLQTNLNESHEVQMRLNDEIHLKAQELHRLDEEKKGLIVKLEQIMLDFTEYKLSTDEQLKNKTLQVAHLEQTIQEQRLEIEKRQEHILELDNKVNDLGYEIKTLLYLHDNEPKAMEKQATQTAVAVKPQVYMKQLEEVEELSTFDSDTHVRTSSDALMLLRRCINTAQKLLGNPYYGNEASRFFEPSLPHYTIDQRRLFDVLRNENGATVFVYSQRDNKMLFVNNQVKHLLGWSPEKFVLEFTALLPKGAEAWNDAVNQLTTDSETHMRLLIKSKEGQEVMTQCQLGAIQAGLFKNHVIGILYIT